MFCAILISVQSVEWVVKSIGLCFLSVVVHPVHWSVRVLFFRVEVWFALQLISQPCTLFIGDKSCIHRIIALHHRLPVLSVDIQI